jgi:hypothetical protein
MSTEAINIHSTQLAYQLGEEGVFTERAVYDPDGSALDVYGIFDDNTYRGDKDAANVFQHITGPRFVVSSITTFDIYDNKILYIVSKDRNYTIDYIDTDEKGALVIWLIG